MATTAKTLCLVDLAIKFPNEHACHQYLASRLWKEGEVICPYSDCGHNNYYVFKDGIRYKCKKCNRIFTAKTSTFMEGSKLPTIKWIFAMFLALHKKGVSSVQLSKDISVTQKTAWFMLHRIRQSFANEEKKNFTGTVELDETFVGGKNKNRHYRKRVEYKEVTGRAYPDKTPVFGMYERESRTIKAMVISRHEFNHIGLTITRNIWPGATLMTDDWTGYRGIDKMYNRFSIEHKKWIYADGDVTTNRIENFWSHFKRGMHGTYIRVTPKHLNKYVQEFVFRFNNRNLAMEHQIDAIIDNMVCRLKYKDLIAA